MHVSVAEANRRLNTKIMVLKCPKHKFTQDELVNNSLCEFIRETRLSKHVDLHHAPNSNQTELEELSKSSECSDGYTLMDFPQV